MTDRADPHRQCPTRADGADPLIEHEIPQGMCMDRQRRHYHKCFTCAHRNATRHTDPKTPSLEELLEQARATMRSERVQLLD